MASRDQLVEYEWVRHSHQVHHGDSVVSPGVDQERRCHVLDRPQGHLLSDSHSCEFSALSSEHFSRKSIPIQGSVFRLFYSSPGLHQGVHSGAGVGSSEGDSASSLP